MLKLIFGFLLLQTGTAFAVRYENIVIRMEQIVKKYPNNAQIFILGKNDQGEAIKGLKIGNGAINSLVVATHHGNEYGSTEVGMGFAEDIAKTPLKDQTLYVIPVLNISGYNLNRREESFKNQKLDSNRDYTGPCVVKPTFQLKSTSMLAQFLVDKKIVSSVTLHTHFPGVLYPWGISTHDLSTPYDATYIELTKGATKESGYKWGNNTELLYPADGTFEDYAYWKHGIWSLLFELGFTHDPDPQEVANMISVNNPGLRRFFENAPKTRATDFAFKGQCDTRGIGNERIFLE